MNVLLVDDDRFVVSVLEKKIDWCSLGITEVFTAHSLLQAQKIFETQQINLLISDIEMPKGSGLDLLSWLRHEGNKVQVIFLTNHADFHYAQKALALQSFEYCLKPIEFDKLVLIIRKAVEKAAEDSLQPKLRENHWQELLRGTVSESPAAKTDRFVLIFISCFPYYLENNEIKSLFPGNIPVNQKLRGFFSDAIGAEQLRLEAFLEYHKEKQQFIAILQPHETSATPPSALISCCTTFLQALKASFQCEASCCISNIFSCQDIQDTFQTLMVYHSELKDCYGRVFTFQDSAPLSMPVPNSPLDQMEHSLETGDETSCIALSSNYLSEAAKSGNLNHKLLSGFLMDTSQLIFTYLKSKEVLAHKLFQNPVYEFLLRQYTDSLGCAESYLYYLTKNSFDYLAFTASQASVAETIKNYIDLNYHQDLNRSTLANIVYLHPDYAARVFKNEMQISLNNYIIQKRIIESKTLLSETCLPVNTIADKVGYGNYSYFSKLFRRETGLTPQEWRRENSI